MEVTIKVLRTITAEADDESEARELLRYGKRVHCGELVEAWIDDSSVVAWCEQCGGPVVDGDTYHMDQDGVFVCMYCSGC